MTQAVSRSQIQTFLAQTEPFNQLAETVLQKLAAECQLLRYRIGQPIIQRELPLTQIAIVYMGQVRVLGYDQRTQTPVSLYMAGPGKVLGWAGLVRGEGCETAIASDEVICITIPSTVFLAFINQEPVLRQAYREQASISEVFELLSLELQRRALGTANLKELTVEVLPQAKVVNLPNGQATLPELDRDLLWMVSSGMIGAFSNGSRFPIQDTPSTWIPVKGKQGGRLLGVPISALPKAAKTVQIIEAATHPETEEPQTDSHSPATSPQSPYEEIPYASETPPTNEPVIVSERPFQHFKGRGPVEAPLACFKMLAKYLGVNFRREIIYKIIDNQIKTKGGLTLLTCGGIAEMMGISAQLIQVQSAAVPRLKAPALIQWQDSFAVLYKISEKELMLAVPEEGIRRRTPKEFAETWGAEGQV